MMDGGDAQRELEDFFGGLTSAMDGGEERFRGIAANLQQQLDEFFDELTSDLEAENERQRGLEAERQRELGHFFGELAPIIQEGEERRRKTAEDLERDLGEMFRLLEPTIAAAMVAIQVMEERAQAEQDRRTGRKFSAFDLVRTQELDLSRIFEGLLDPAGSHSQGDLFLSLLLEELHAAPGKAADVLLGFQPPAGMASRVQREYSISTDSSGTPRGFIDLVVELDHNRWIGIENKPWAIDQEEQLPRYLYALQEECGRRQSGDVDKSVLILYLSGNGSGPDLDVRSRNNRELCAEAKKRIRSLTDEGPYWKNWLTVPYRQQFLSPSVEGWLKRCCAECRAERVLEFLRDLLNYIQLNFRDPRSHSTDFRR